MSYDDRLAYLAPAAPRYNTTPDIAEAVLQALGLATVHGPIHACTRERACNHRFLMRVTGRPTRIFLESFYAVQEEHPELSPADVARSIVGVNIEGAALTARGETYLGEIDSTAEIFAAPGNVSNAA